MRVLLVGVLALSGCQAVEKVKKAVVPAPHPKIGACHRLDFIDVYSPATYFDPTEPVDCAKSHTSITYRTGDLPMPLSLSDFEYHDGVRADDARNYALDKCASWGAEAAGLTEEEWQLTLVDFAAFLPSPAEVDAGASWFRCDLVAAYGDKILPLPSGADLPLFDKGIPDAYAVCTDRNFNPRLCTSRHYYLYDRAFEMPEGRYPGRRAFIRFGDRKCTGDSYTWPTRRQWRDGDRWIECGRVDKDLTDPT